MLFKKKFENLNFDAIAGILLTQNSVYLHLLADELKKSSHIGKVDLETCHKTVESFMMAINREVESHDLTRCIGFFVDGRIVYDNPRTLHHLEITDNSVYFVSEVPGETLSSIEASIKRHA